MKKITQLLRRAFMQWLEDNAQRMGAALAFYMVFSLAPFLILIISAAGFLFGQRVVQSETFNQISSLIGYEGAQAVEMLMQGARRHVHGGSAAALGIMTLLAGSAGALFELQDGLNRVWKLPTVAGWKLQIRRKLLSLTLILVVAFVLLMSLLVSATLSAFSHWLTHYVPVRPFFFQAADLMVSWAVITFLFALIYKVLPDTVIAWGDVWTGAAVASILFTIGKFVVGLYIGKSAINSTYGAAGSFVIVLFWVYYSSLLLYFGAEFTKAYADRYGSKSESEE